MNKARLALILGLLLVLGLSASAFAELVVTYSSSDDTRSEYTIEDNQQRINQAAANSLIDNGCLLYTSDAADE